MAVDRVAKLLVAVHRDASESFVSALQRLGTFHITHTEEVESGGVASELDRRFGHLEDTITLLGTRVKRKGGLLGDTKVPMTRAEFEAVPAEYESEASLNRARGLTRDLDELGNRERTLLAERVRLVPWRALRQVPADLYSMESVAVVCGRFADSEEIKPAREALLGKDADVEEVSVSESGAMALVVGARDAADEVNQILGQLRFEVVDLKHVTARPAEALLAIDTEQATLNERRAAIEDELKGLAAELPSMKAVADHVLNSKARIETEAALERTESVLLITGWVRERDLGRVEGLVNDTGAAAMKRLEPERDEEPPVALVNRKFFRPFELVLDLYSMPSPREVDPTVLLAPFFAIFFGFCLTDAGYGIVLVVIAALLMKKMGSSNKLIGMLFIGGFFTIIAGALVGGWFGDLPDKLGVPALVMFKNRLMWFDPLTNPMPFFILSLGMGYAHMMYGMIIEIVDSLRVRRPGDALLGQLPWFLALNSLVLLVILGKSLPAWVSVLLLVVILGSVAAIVVFTQRERSIALAQTMWFVLFWLAFVFFAARLGGLPSGFLYVKWAVLAVFVGIYVYSFIDLVKAQSLKVVPIVIAAVGIVTLGLWLAGILPWLVPALVGMAFFFAAPSNRSVAGKLAWGGYALYGATSYVGVVLSYIRIMALGMVTGGIAMAINTVAWMVTGVPVLGVVLAVIALVLGHSYNIAVNVLGAFVHTLRLNYVEFFPRFFTGGGEPFVPFREENRYIAVR